MSEDLYKTIFSKNLKHYMEINGKNQTDLMNDLGLGSSTVSSWCTGQKLPRMNKIQMLADYFGIEKSDLLEEKRRNNNGIVDDHELRRIQRARKNMTDKEKDDMMKLLEISFKEYFDDDKQLSKTIHKGRRTISI